MSHLALKPPQHSHNPPPNDTGNQLNARRNSHRRPRSSNRLRLLELRRRSAYGSRAFAPMALLGLFS